MPFVLRSNTFPSLTDLTAIPQIVIVDQAGPNIFVGPGTLAVAMVGEFLKGPFRPTEVTSPGQLDALYGGVSKLLSQDGSGVQNGSGVGFNGNGRVAMKGRTFKRLVLCRVDCDMTTTDGGANKALVRFNVTVASSDQDPNNATLTGRDIVIPAGTRFADAALGSATAVVALSQDITIPKGTTITSGVVTVDQTFVNGNGTLGATAFFVKGTTLGSGALNTVIDPALPNINSTISNTGISSITSAGGATSIFAAGTAALQLAPKIVSRYPAAIDKLKPTDSPQNQIKAVWSARLAATIRDYLDAHALAVNAGFALGRVAIVSADPAAGNSATQAANALAAAESLASGESINHASTAITFPHRQVFIDELATTVTIPADTLLASIVSNFSSEVNPGADPSPLLDDTIALEQAFVDNPLAKQDYINLQAAGVCGLIKDPDIGWWFSNGVTAVNPSVSPAFSPLNREFFAFEVQATLAKIAAPYQKLPATTERVDAFVGEVEAYVETLVRPGQRSLQRAKAAAVDPKSGNTEQLNDLGVFVVIVQVQMLGDLDTIVFQTQIGATVQIQQAA